MSAVGPTESVVPYRRSGGEPPGGEPPGGEPPGGEPPGGEPPGGEHQSSVAVTSVGEEASRIGLDGRMGSHDGRVCLERAEEDRRGLQSSDTVNNVWDHVATEDA
ncbi:hypothetical protein LTS10_010188 [Elasticomyces elasticus]|nr:hypothetical protein LTS10_010188 [Elasticomyces elasticus]